MEKQTIAFINGIVAMMKDVASTRKLGQLKTQLEVNGRMQQVRIIIVPENMDLEFGKPLEHDELVGVK